MCFDVRRASPQAAAPLELAAKRPPGHAVQAASADAGADRRPVKSSSRNRVARARDSARPGLHASQAALLRGC